MVSNSAARKVRIAIVGASPCGGCSANCCKQNGHDFAVLLREEEGRKFAAYCVEARFERDGRIVIERVLPCIDGRCQFLGADDRCTIYGNRPRACSAFECTRYYNERGIGRHGRFLELNPDVRERLLAL
jgi:Fe-S-cluster containining protein